PREAVAVARLPRRQVPCPHSGVDLRDLPPPFRAVVVEEAQLDALGDFREEGEIGARAVEGGAQGVGPSGPDLHVPRVDAPPWAEGGTTKTPSMPRGPCVVGDTGIEPVTSSVSGKRATAAPIARCVRGRGGGMERTTGFEPATLTLAR